MACYYSPLATTLEAVATAVKVGDRQGSGSHLSEWDPASGAYSVFFSLVSILFF